MNDIKKKNDEMSRREFLAAAGMAGISVITGNQFMGNVQSRYDLVLSGGRVIDPASGVDAVLNIGILKGKIAAISHGRLHGRKTFNATGRIVSPGFIDVHTHVDGLLYAGQCMAQMGVTTTIGGNCGFSFIPEAKVSGYDLESFFNKIDTDGFPVNHAYLAGTQMFRQMAGLDKREAPDESAVSYMADLAQKAIDQGAIGVSFGIEYQPGTIQKELEALFQVAAKNRSIATVHPRYTGRGFPFVQPSAIEGYREIIEAAGKTGVKMEISHLGGQIAWQSDPYDALTMQALESIESARNSGIDITGDCYPYAAWCTTSDAASLDYFLKGDVMLWLIKKRYFLEMGMLEVGSGPYKGEHLTPELLEKLRKKTPKTWIIGHAMKEDLVETIFQRPYVMAASDGVYNIKTGMPSHPRGRGTFPRILKKMVRDKKALSLKDALYKMTIQPAERFGLTGKGTISVGADADITVIDLKRIDDRSTYLDPDRAPTGIDYVFVNGVPVVESGALKSVLPGKSVRRES